ncbi:hypothetical protein EZV73_09630 [Acidaminobacter sp. JC074]|uniref:hypothetical protein n=1 Tax=Acidaminobacter sp. JC074 TaxID=2530199 RepID=UPI001F0F40ED|nr:hypothetical protein [Acidaminobacter sp. JC074]MCH4887834.1 hypothetical protein [Acidaminobacter sp. JC074]
MKKVLLYVFISLMVIALYACDEGGPENHIIDLLNDEELNTFSEQDIAIRLEVEEILLRRLLIDYDTFRIAYKEFLIYKDDPDHFHAGAYILRSIPYDELLLADFIGLNVKEMRKLLEEETDMKRYFRILNMDSDIAFTLSVTGIYEGYDKDESYVYVTVEKETQTILYAYTYKYHFKEVDGMKKILQKNYIANHFYDKDGSDQTNKEPIYYYKRTDQGIKEEPIQYDYIIDMNHFLEKYYDYDITPFVY